MALKKLWKNLFGGGGSSARTEIETARGSAEAALEDLRRVAEGLDAAPPALAAEARTIAETRDRKGGESSGPQAVIEVYEAAAERLRAARGELLRANPEWLMRDWADEMGRAAEDVIAPLSRIFAFLQASALHHTLGNEEESRHLCGRALATIETGEHVTAAMSSLANLRSLGAAPDEAWLHERCADILDRIEGMGDPSEEVSAVCELVRGRAALGDMEGALASARDIEDPWFGEQALAAVLEARAAAGDPEGARELLDELTDPALVGAARKNIVAAEARCGELAAALAGAREIEDPEWRAPALAEIAEQQALDGDLEAAIELASEIEEPQWHADALRGIANARARAADEAGMDRAASLVEDPAMREGILVEASATFADAGELDAALRAAERLTLPEVRVLALATTARALAKGGRIEEGRASLELATELAENGISGSAHDVLLASIAEVHVRAGDVEEGIAAFEGTPRPDFPALRLHRIAMELASAGDVERLAEIERTCREPMGRTWLLLGAVTALARKA